MSILGKFITQDDFNYAVECLEDCKQNSAKQFGFNYPYFAPGGRYGEQWWQLDSSLALCGYKWIDRAFAETSILNFIESQKECAEMLDMTLNEYQNYCKNLKVPNKRKKEYNSNEFLKFLGINETILKKRKSC